MVKFVCILPWILSYKSFLAYMIRSCVIECDGSPCKEEYIGNKSVLSAGVQSFSRVCLVLSLAGNKVKGLPSDTTQSGFLSLHSCAWQRTCCSSAAALS